MQRQEATKWEGTPRRRVLVSDVSWLKYLARGKRTSMPDTARFSTAPEGLLTGQLARLTKVPTNRVANDRRHHARVESDS